MQDDEEVTVLYVFICTYIVGLLATYYIQRKGVVRPARCGIVA